MDKNEIDRAACGFFETVKKELGLPDSILKRLRVKSSLVVNSLDGMASYWLAPLASGDRLVGFLRLDLQGQLLAYGRFGQGRQLKEFPPISYLSQETADKAIRRAFSNKYKEIIPPQLVHDGPKEKIAWLSRNEPADDIAILLFWSFGTTYSRTESKNRDHQLSSGHK